MICRARSISTHLKDANQYLISQGGGDERKETNNSKDFIEDHLVFSSSFDWSNAQRHLSKIVLDFHRHQKRIPNEKIHLIDNGFGFDFLREFRPIPMNRTIEANKMAVKGEKTDV